jgi:uncharacterized protein with GYD domain
VPRLDERPVQDVGVVAVIAGRRLRHRDHPAHSVSGSLESAYWMFGAHDEFAVVDVPDSVRAAALSVAVGSTGAFKHLETHELLTQDQLGQT